MTRTVSPSPEQLSELRKQLRDLASFNREHYPTTTEPEFYALGDEAADALKFTQAEIARLTTALRSAKMLCDNINEFGSVTDHEIFVGADEAISAALKGNQP